MHPNGSSTRYVPRIVDSPENVAKGRVHREQGYSREPSGHLPRNPYLQLVDVQTVFHYLHLRDVIHGDLRVLNFPSLPNPVSSAH